MTGVICGRGATKLVSNKIKIVIISVEVLDTVAAMTHRRIVSGRNGTARRGDTGSPGGGEPRTDGMLTGQRQLSTTQEPRVSGVCRF